MISIGKALAQWESYKTHKIDVTLKVKISLIIYILNSNKLWGIPRLTQTLSFLAVLIANAIKVIRSPVQH